MHIIILSLIRKCNGNLSFETERSQEAKEIKVNYTVSIIYYKHLYCRLKIEIFELYLNLEASRLITIRHSLIKLLIFQIGKDARLNKPSF